MRIILLLTALMFTSNSYAYFWVDNGDSIRANYHADEDQFNAEYWRILLFKRGDGTDPSNNKPWGSISGDTAAEVRRKLEKSQSDEKRWETWTGIPWGESTFFNPFGPVAIIKVDKSDKVKRVAKALLKKINESWNNSALGQDMDKARKSIEEIKKMVQADRDVYDILESASNSDKYLIRKLSIIDRGIYTNPPREFIIYRVPDSNDESFVDKSTAAIKWGISGSAKISNGVIHMYNNANETNEAFTLYEGGKKSYFHRRGEDDCDLDMHLMPISSTQWMYWETADDNKLLRCFGSHWEITKHSCEYISIEKGTLIVKKQENCR